MVTERMPPICMDCPNYASGCEQLDPFMPGAQLEDGHTHCFHYSCDTGLRMARRGYGNAPRVEIETSGGKRVSAFAFGTAHKPSATVEEYRLLYGNSSSGPDFVEMYVKWKRGLTIRAPRGERDYVAEFRRYCADDGRIYSTARDGGLFFTGQRVELPFWSKVKRKIKRSNV